MIFEPVHRQGRNPRPDTLEARYRVHKAIMRASGPVTEQTIARQTRQRRALVKIELQRLASYGVLQVTGREKVKRGRPLNVYRRV